MTPIAKDIKKLYKIDEKLAREAAHVLGYEIRSHKKKKKVEARESLDQVVDYLSKQLFQYTQEEANKKSFHLRASADEFEKYLKKFLTSKLR